MTVTVSQVNRRLLNIIKADKTLGDIFVKGEISNFVFHRTGHLYFSLKDEDCTIKAVMFRQSAEKLTFMPENGMKVVVRCNIQLFERDGICQLYVGEIEQDGAGLAALAFEQLKQRLEAEGLFSRKRELPAFPKTICIITSESGAALQDMLNILNRRCPIVKVKLISTLVQGMDAPASLIKAIKTAQNTDSEIIIIGRGGGSAEDLSAFNSEAVARAVFSSRIPVLSAIGHETDTTITDYVSDLRAPTPSAAAELAVPDIFLVYSALEETRRILRDKAFSIIQRKQSEALLCAKRIVRFTPEEKLSRRADELNRAERQIQNNYRDIIGRKELQLEKAIGVLEALSHVNTLKRGFSIVYKHGAVINSVLKLEAGDEISIKLADGVIDAVVKQLSQ